MPEFWLVAGGLWWQPVHSPLHQQAQDTIQHHVFDLACKTLGVEHPLIPPRHPQTNDMVERFNRRISDVLHARFDSGEELETTIKRYAVLYNHRIPQKALDHKTPFNAMQDWQKKRRDLFVKKISNHMGPDSS